MADTTCHMSISLDGFVAGPDQSTDHPLGRRGGELHTWHMPGVEVGEADVTAASWLMRPRGAYVMGRNMFGPVRGEPTPQSKLNTVCQILFCLAVVGSAAFALPPDAVVVALGALVFVTTTVSGIDYVLIYSRRAAAVSRTRTAGAH